MEEKTDVVANLKVVEENIKNAAIASGRDPKDITLIAVTKTKPFEMLMEAYDEGIRDFGENKVQDLVAKWELAPKDSRFHMIGHLQKNKVKYLIGKAFLIHGVDSYELAAEIEKQFKTTIDKKKIVMDPIKTTGVHDVTVKLHKEISAVVKVAVGEA